MRYSLCHRFKVKTFVAAALLTASGLQSCQDENLVGQPSWLNNSIYGWLQEQGNYEYTLRLVDDLDMASVLNQTGSKTIFAADDAAFESFFKENQLECEELRTVVLGSEKDVAQQFHGEQCVSDRAAVERPGQSSARGDVHAS